MKALKEEEEQKTKRMKDQIDAVSRDIKTLSQTISETEKQLRAADTSFLLKYKAAVDKVQRCFMVQEPKMEHGALIEETEHLGNLRFNVWKKMKSLVQYYPVLLDPNTAAPELIVSEDLTSVRAGERQKVPANPGRCPNKAVRLSTSFVSGIHIFDVDVSGNKNWAVGVLGNGKKVLVSFCNNRYTAISFSGARKHFSMKYLQRIRVKLDCNKKTVTFTDADTNLLFHTDTDISIGELVPILLTDTSLKILPMAVSLVNSAFQRTQCFTFPPPVHSLRW